MTAATDLPPAFRHIRLLLARESRHPTGDAQDGYDILAPLGSDGRLDAAGWKRHQERCRVRRFCNGHADRIGRLRRKPGGQWYIDYEPGARDDEIGFRLGEERFVTGEYVSLGRDGRMRTYQVARVERP